MARRDDEAILRIGEEERRSHRRSRPARVPEYFQNAALVFASEAALQNSAAPQAQPRRCRLPNSTPIPSRTIETPVSGIPSPMLEQAGSES